MNVHESMTTNLKAEETPIPEEPVNNNNGPEEAIIIPLPKPVIVEEVEEVEEQKKDEEISEKGIIDGKEITA